MREEKPEEPPLAAELERLFDKPEMTNNKPDYTDEKLEEIYFRAAFKEPEPISWKYWVSMQSWTAGQAARLMVGLEPDAFDNLSTGAKDSEVQRQRATKIERLAINNGMTVSSAREWLVWAKEQRFNLHPLFEIEILAAQQTDSKSSAPAIETAQNAAKVEATRGIKKSDVIVAFQGLHFDYDHWGKNLASPPKWLKECRVTPGVRGKQISATWNPVQIAAALLDKGIQIQRLDAVFVSLNDWATEWRKASDYFRNAP